MESTSLSWSSSGVYQESIRSIRTLSGLLMESIRSPSGVHQESIRSLSGVHQEYQDFIRTPDGLHQDSWGSVTYSNVSFLVQWNLGDTTWEPYAECKELTALDRYLELLGINDEDWKKLLRKSSTANRQMSQSSNAKAPTRRVNHKRT